MSKLFVLGEKERPSIRELGHDYQSRQISISGLENVKDHRDVPEGILKGKENLKELEWPWERERKWEGDAGNSSKVKRVLERLQPHPHIEYIKIVGFGGTEFPKWVGDASFSKLQKMLLSGCENRICLPPFGQLASLKELSIDGYERLEDIGMEFYGKWEKKEQQFSSLKRLKFVGMKNWKQWSSQSGVFPVLEELELFDCPKLPSIPDHFPSLERLRVENCHTVDCISLNTFPNLKELVLRYCSNLKSLRSRSSTIDPLFSSCSKLVTLLRGGPHSLLPSLQELELHNCPELMSFLSDLPSLKGLRIEDCLKLDFENLSISTCATLETIRIHSCSKLVSFPTGELHAPKLKEIDLSDCGNLKSLPQGMLSQLPSLKKLSISNCPEIESSPEGGLPPELESLEINKCEKLDFVVGENGGPIINALGKLHSLRGEISFRVSENVNNDGVVSEAILKGEVNLKMLKLSWNGDANSSRKVKQVLNRLQPHIQMEYIWIRSCQGKELLDWVRGISFTKLKEMRLDGCDNCICLPPLRQLASLEKLSINCTRMVIGLEFHGECKTWEKPFKSLKTLEIRGMKNRREWSSFNGAFPVLEELELCDCPKLMSVPINLPRLKRLRISGCGRLDFDDLISECYSLETVDIRGSEKVEFLTSRGVFARSVTSLTIWGCPNLVTFGRGRGFFRSLEELELRDCPKLLSVPINLPRLKRLRISGCGQLRDFGRLLFFVRRTLETIDFRDSEKVKCIQTGNLSQLKGI